MSYTHLFFLVRSQKTITLLIILGLVTWFFAIPAVVHKTHAANLTNVSDTLTDSDLSAASNHTILFTMPNGLNPGETITITFPAGFTIPGPTDFNDIDFASSSGDYDLAGTCSGSTFGAAVSGQVITFTSCTDPIASSSAMTVEIGTNATFQTTGNDQITNPSSAGSYEIVIAGSLLDDGRTRVAIIDDVIVTAEVGTSFTFTIAGVATSSAVNATTTTIGSSAVLIPFQLLTVDLAAVGAQDLTVTTNARNGFVVTVSADQSLTSATNADIDTFIDGATTSTPTAWVDPLGTLGSENTYGHWGITSEDSDLNSDEFGAALFAGNFINNPRQIFSHDGPSDGSTADIGSTRIGYATQVTSLQEAATDYTATLTYVATPTF